MTLSGHRRRRPAARPDRWLLAFATLVLALGVVVMHSLGIGHHGPSHLAPGGQPMAMAGAGAAHQVTANGTSRHEATHHRSSPSGGAVAHGHGAAPAARPAVSGVASPEVRVETAGEAASTAERIVAAGASHGATAMCLAVLPVLVLLRRRGGGAWFARAVAAARRAVLAETRCCSIVRPRPPGSILTELCILRT